MLIYVVQSMEAKRPAGVFFRWEKAFSSPPRLSSNARSMSQRKAAFPTLLFLRHHRGVLGFSYSGRIIRLANNEAKPVGNARRQDFDASLRDETCFMCNVDFLAGSFCLSDGQETLRSMRSSAQHSDVRSEVMTEFLYRSIPLESNTCISFFPFLARKIRCIITLVNACAVLCFAGEKANRNKRPKTPFAPWKLSTPEQCPRTKPRRNATSPRL